MVMNVTLRQLSYFIALLETRHFGRADERMHVTQPALSMQIRELERSLGTQLFERDPRGVRLTLAGRGLERRARRIQAEVQQIDAEARRGHGGRLHLGVIPTIAPYLLPRALPGLRAMDATRDLRLREAQTDVLLEGLESGQLDAIVIASSAPNVAHESRTLFEDRFVFAARADHLAALGSAHEALRPRAIDPEQLLLLDEGHCLADQALEVCALDRGQRRFDLGASSLATLCGLVAQGLGYTFLPEIALRAERAAAPGLSVTRFAPPEPSRRIVLVRRPGGDAARWFDDLGDVLRAAGESMLAEVRAAV